MNNKQGQSAINLNRTQGELASCKITNEQAPKRNQNSELKSLSYRLPKKTKIS